MNKYRYLKRFFALFLILAVGFTTVQSVDVGASKISKARKEKRQAAEALKVEKKLMAKITKKRESLEKEIASVDEELVAIMVDIQITKDDISDKKDQIHKLAVKQEKTEQEVADQKEAIMRQVKFMYENDNEVTDVIFKAKSISELLNNVEYYNDVYDYSETLLENYKASLQKVIDLKEEAKALRPARSAPLLRQTQNKRPRCLSVGSSI